MQFLHKFYGLLLNLFPKNYREEYGDEVQAVFNLMLADAARQSGLELARVLLQEFNNLPGAIIHEHLRERRKLKMAEKPVSRFDFEPGSRTESFLALAPFLFFGGIPVILGWLQYSGVIPLWFAIAFVLVFWGSGLSLFVIGLKKGAPRWFMPYLGVPLPIISLIVFNTLISPEWHGFPFLREASWFVRQFFHGGVLWIWLLLLVLLIFLLTKLIPRFRSFHQRLQADWTLLCFLLYGSMPFVIVISFEEFKIEEPYVLLAFLSLALGGWLYLRSRTLWKKFWSLLGGLTLSMSFAVLGQTLLHESSFPFTNFPRWTTTLSTVIMWMWMTLFMLVSAALNLLPLSDVQPETT